MGLSKNMISHNIDKAGCNNNTTPTIDAGKLGIDWVINNQPMTWHTMPRISKETSDWVDGMVIFNPSKLNCMNNKSAQIIDMMPRFAKADKPFLLDCTWRMDNIKPVYDRAVNRP